MRRPRSGRTIVETAGSPVRLLETSLPVLSVHAFPLASNTGVVAIGGPETRETDSEDAGMPFRCKDCEFALEDTDLSLIWVDAGVAGEGVRWVAIIEES